EQRDQDGNHRHEAYSGDAPNINGLNTYAIFSRHRWPGRPQRDSYRLDPARILVTVSRNLRIARSGLATECRRSVHLDEFEVIMCSRKYFIPRLKVHYKRPDTALT